MKIVYLGDREIDAIVGGALAYRTFAYESYFTFYAPRVSVIRAPQLGQDRHYNLRRPNRRGHAGIVPGEAV